MELKWNGLAKGATAAGAAVGLGVALAGVAQAQPADPPGNNGTVKIDAEAFDDHPNNEPHVGCVFQVDFYGFDEGDLSADVLFEGQAPTGGGELGSDTLDIGEDAAGGGTDLDASGTYDLSAALAGIEPHPEQGWHVKLTVHAEGSQGADTKHKVFWVEECAPGEEKPPGEEMPPGEEVPPGEGAAPPAAPIVKPPDFAG